MKKSIDKALYILSAVLTILGILADTFMQLGTSGKILFYLFPILLIFIKMIIQLKITKDPNEKKEIRRHSLMFIFILYVTILVSLLFLSSSYRYGNLFTWTRKYPLFSEENISINLNIIPFKNIIEYINKLINHRINTSIVITNILGNIIAFAPFGFFIPELFSDKIKNIKQFSLLMFLLIISVEVIQFITRVGSFDIDDLILNLLGAIIVYIIYSKNSVKKLVNKILE